MSVSHTPGQNNVPTQANTNPILTNNSNLQSDIDAASERSRLGKEAITKKTKVEIDKMIEGSLDKEIDHIIKEAGYNGHFEYDAQSGIQYDVQGFGKMDVDTKIFNMSILRQVRDADFIVKDPNRGYDMRWEAKYVIDKLNARMDQRRTTMETNKEGELTRISDMVVVKWESVKDMFYINSSWLPYGIKDNVLEGSTLEVEMIKHNISQKELTDAVRPKIKEIVEWKKTSIDFSAEPTPATPTQPTPTQAAPAQPTPVQPTPIQAAPVQVASLGIPALNPKLQDMKDLVANVDFSSNRYNDIYTAHPELVEAIQDMLEIEKTGSYDSTTFEAVKAFQGEKWLAVDWLAGPNTMKIIIEDKIPATRTGNPNNQYASNNYNWSGWTNPRINLAP